MEKNLTNYPQSLKTIRKWFPRIERLSPPLARYMARKLFFTPLRYEVPRKEREFAGKARQFKFSYGKISLQAYEWGGDGPVVILLHGWSGRATQLGAFVDPLLAAGYKVAALDAPGHNASPGKYADLVLFSEALTALASRYGALHSVIGHSMGGAAAFHAVQDGLNVSKIVTIGTPSIAGDIIKNFTHIINSSDRIAPAITGYIKKTYGKTFDQFSTLETGKDVHVPVLVVHDENDSEVAVRDAKALVPVLKHGRLLITQGLGHTRILRDSMVIEKAIGFIKGADAFAEIKKAV